MHSSFYTGPGKPRLRTNGWDDLIAAVEAGVLTETQWVELKYAIPPTSPQANTELAKDLASLSVDGGVLLVGIKDPGQDASDVIGTEDVERLKLRIDQTANSRIAPALHIQMATIANPADPDRAVLVVTVPASTSAPHMVDEKYWGRSATGKRPLTDSEASRLWALRRGNREDFTRTLHALSDVLDPIPADRRKFGHLYLLLQPVAPSVVRLTDVLHGMTPGQLVETSTEPGYRPAWSPSMDSLSHHVAHPDGIAAASVDLAHEPAENHLLYLLLGDDSSLRVVSGQGTREFIPDSDTLCISANYTMEIAHSTIALAGHLATDYTGYDGTWNLGIHINGLNRLYPAQAMGDRRHDRRWVPYQGQSYTRITTAATTELIHHTPTVVERLVADLARGLGLREHLFPYTHPKEIHDRHARR